MKDREKKLIPTALFILYALILVWVILFKLSLSFSDLPRYQSLNLIPFHYDTEVDFHFREVMANIIIFIPFGILLKMLNIKGSLTLLYGFGFSLFFELFQYILHIGSSDITDLITNTLGTAIGILIYLLTAKICKSRDRANSLFSGLAIGTATGLSLLFLLVFLAIS